jgi:DNA mismatch repair protein MutL
VFYATPARLKFLKSDASELSACVAVFEKQALAQPHVRFTLTHHGRSLRTLPPAATFQERAATLLGADFVAASKEINAVRGDLKLRGLVASPTFNKANSTSQYVFVGGRPVNDRVLFSAIRAGYADVLSHGRYAAVLLFLDVPPEQVDVNVHPAKIEVRFSDAAAVKSLVIGAIREAVTATAGAFAHALPLRPASYAPATTSAAPQRAMPYGAYPSLPPLQRHLGEHTPQSFAPSGRSFTAPDTAERPALATAPAGALGVATAQVFDTYIIAEAGDAVVLVDQHAAHERLVYEQLKAGIAADADSKSQTLLIPDVVPLPPAAREALLARRDALATMGLELESFGGDALLVRAVPLALGKTSSAGLLSDLAAAILENDSVAALQEKILDVLANVACRRSIKAGQKLNTHEMNALLRQMEETPAAGQCNHGRPTYITLTRSELERLFKR